MPYPEMNEKICELLRMEDEVGVGTYAAERIEKLESELAEARREKLRAEKVAAMANAWPEEIKGAEDLLKNIPQQLAIEMPKDAIWLAVCDYLAEAEMEGNDG